VVKTSATSSFVTLASYFTSLGNNFLNFKMPQVLLGRVNGLKSKRAWNGASPKGTAQETADE
jgi:hypothetical protein